MPPDVSVCPGCGSRLTSVEGPVHAYMTSSPACWAAFGRVMAREYSDPALMAVHRLSVDAWAVQHPGDGSRRAIQSVGLHLARLGVQIETGASGAGANASMLGFAERKAELPPLTPPDVWPITVAEVVESEAPEAHAKAVHCWAGSVWSAMPAHHEFICRWASGGAW